MSSKVHNFYGRLITTFIGLDSHHIALNKYHIKSIAIKGSNNNTNTNKKTVWVAVWEGNNETC